MHGPKVEYTTMIIYYFKFLLTLYSHASDACINITNFMKNLTKGQIFKIRKTKTKKHKPKGSITSVCDRSILNLG